MIWEIHRTQPLHHVKRVVLKFRLLLVCLSKDFVSTFSLVHKPVKFYPHQRKWKRKRKWCHFLNHFQTDRSENHVHFHLVWVDPSDMLLSLLFSVDRPLKLVGASRFWKSLIHTNMPRFLRTKFFVSWPDFFPNKVHFKSLNISVFTINITWCMLNINFTYGISIFTKFLWIQ